ncbi:hypothetical protein K2X83_02790 [Patescibacteria group bacterium]|nr:hypothetical protein [Patescibacteria group bacterium]
MILNISRERATIIGNDVAGLAASPFPAHKFLYGILKDIGVADQKEKLGRLGVLEQWRERQWAAVDVEVPPGAYESAAAAFTEFIRDVPDKLKRAICVAVSSEGENATRTDLGFRERKPESDTDGEDKAYFHYSPEVETLFASEIEAAGAPAKNFMKHARKIWDAAFTAAERVVRDLEEEYPGMYKGFAPSGMLPFLKLRFLMYRKVPKGKLLGVGHYDRGTVTLALAESAPGLRIGRDHADLKKIQRERGEAVVMAGTAMRLIEPDRAKLPLSWHDVEQSEGASLNETDARWSIIGLLNSYDYEEVPSLCSTHHPE